MPEATEFVGRTEPYRRELLAHCYRMLGSVDDAEDVVQETYLRAWRSYGTFEGRSSVRTWLYRIATNACLTALAHRARRHLPSGLGAPSLEPEAPPTRHGDDVAWLQPVPDSLVSAETDDPAVIVATRDSLRLALIACLQYLPGRQRAVLLLRDVLAWPAAEVAETLGTTTAAVKSTLQRARARAAELDPDGPRPAGGAAAPVEAALLSRYIEAFENADAAALGELLTADATLEATPLRTWFAGRSTCLRYLDRQVLGEPGDWRLTATAANGQPAAVAHLRRADGRHHPYGIVVLTVGEGGIRRIVAFDAPGLVERFGPGVRPPRLTVPAS
jgi:RNA polymerase sigma-70 factor, ECF subfamily